MLLGNGFLLDKLPMNQIGGLVSNNNFTNPSMMLKAYTAFKQYDSIPAGYGGRSITLPIKAGAGSIIDRVAVAQYASMANINDTLAITINSVMGAYAKASASDVVIISATGQITAYADASADATVVVNVSAFIGAVMGASANDSTHVTMSGTVGALLGASVHDTVTFTMSGNIGGYYGGVVHDVVTVSSTAPIIFGSALASADDNVHVVMTSSAKGDGWMRADAVEGSTVLTAKEIWEYYERTMTSGGVGGSGLTIDEHIQLMKTATKADVVNAAMM